MERYPFRLQVTIFYATNLPVADLISSDPFVSLCVGEKQFGRTKTKFKTHKRPEWNETFHTSILFLQQNLVLNIFDDDHLAFKDHDLLGIVTIPLQDLPVNNPTRSIYSITNAGGFRANSTIEVEIIVSRNYQLISLLSQSSKLLSRHDSLQTMVYESVNEIQDTTIWNQSPAIVRQTLLDLALEGYTTYITKEILIDLLTDALTLDPCYRSEHHQLKDHYLIRNEQVVIGTSSQPINSPSSRDIIRWSPIAATTLMILCAQNKVIMLSFPSKIALWVWVLWLQHAAILWKAEQVVKSKWPIWMTKSHGILTQTNVKYRCHPHTNHNHKEGVEQQGTLTLSMDKPFLLAFNHHGIGLHDMSQLVIGSDTTDSLSSSSMKPYALEIAIQSLQMPSTISSSSSSQLPLPSPTKPIKTGGGGGVTMPNFNFTKGLKLPGSGGISATSAGTRGGDALMMTFHYGRHHFTQPLHFTSSTSQPSPSKPTLTNTSPSVGVVYHPSSRSPTMVLDLHMSDMLPTDRFFQESSPVVPPASSSTTTLSSTTLEWAVMGTSVASVLRALPSKKPSLSLPTLDIYIHAKDHPTDVLGQKSIKLTEIITAKQSSRRVNVMDLLQLPIFRQAQDIALDMDHRIGKSPSFSLIYMALMDDSSPG